MGTCIGLDLGGTYIKGALVSTGGEVLAWEKAATQAEQGFRHVLTRMETMISTLSGKANPDAVGIGIPGMLDIGRSRVLLAPNLGWEDVALKEELEQCLDIPVFLDNDANAAALGEWWLGSAQNTDSFLLVTIGTGIGSGMLLEGKLYRGACGLAPELGHMTVAVDGPACRCGQKGCLETLVSAPAILRQARENKLEIPEDGSVKDVFDLAQKGDKIAVGVVAQTMEFLAVGLKNAIVLLEPQLILIGGGIGDSSGAFLDMLRERIVQLLPVKRRINILQASLGNRAGALGAACLAFMEGKEK